MALYPFAVENPLTELFTLHPMEYDHGDELWSPFHHFWPFTVRRPVQQKRKVWHERVPLHGLKPEQCKVTKEERLITVSGECKTEDGEVNFTRRVHIPETIDEKTVEWEFIMTHGGYLVIKGMTPEVKPETVVQDNPDKPFRLQMNCYGIDPKHIKVKLHNRVLTIDGAEEIKIEDGSTTKRSVMERVLLPASVDLQTIKPTMCNGQLTIEAQRLPPTEALPSTDLPIHIEDKKME